MTDASAETWSPPVAHANIGDMTAEQAQQAIDEIKGDRTFGAAFANGNTNAKEHLSKLMNRAYNPEASQPTAAATPAAKAQAARAELKRLTQDKAWGAKYLAGDIDAKKLFNELTTAAAAVSDADLAKSGSDISEYSNVRITVEPDDDIAMVGKVQDALRQSFFEMQVPAPLAQGIVQHLEYMSAKSANWTDAEYNDAVAAAEQELKGLWGSDYSKNVAMAEAVLQRATSHSAFMVQLLADTATNISPWFIKNLVLLAEHQGVKI